MIPKKLHVIWIGDANDCPHECISTWRDHHPDWTLTVWDNDSLANYSWSAGAQMRVSLGKEMRLVADCMRWEILYNEGGFVVDADMVCLQPLPAWLPDCRAVVSWQNELELPGMLTTAVVGCEQGNAFIGEILLRIISDATLTTLSVSAATGAERLTATWKETKYQDLTVLPSRYFLPRAPSVEPYTGNDQVYGYKKCYAAMGGRAFDFQQYLPPYRPGAIAPEDGPFFTVGIANFNRGAFIAEAILSVLQQDYPHFELLIIDDGSTDNSDEVVGAFTDPRVRYVKKEHSGIPRTVNVLIEQAIGSHVVWMGNDDLLMPGVLAAYAKMIQIWPEVVFAYGDLTKIDTNGQDLEELTFTDYFGDRLLLSRFLISNIVPGPGSMANLGIMRAVGGFDNDIPLSNDYDLWVRLAATGLPFKHIGRITCRYRWHGNNVSARQDLLAVDDLQILHKMLGTYDLPQVCTDLDWRGNPLAAEVAACSRIELLLTRKDDHQQAAMWARHRGKLQSGIS